MTVIRRPTSYFIKLWSQKPIVTHQSYIGRFFIFLFSWLFTKYKSIGTYLSKNSLLIGKINPHSLKFILIALFIFLLTLESSISNISLPVSNQLNLAEIKNIKNFLVNLSFIVIFFSLITLLIKDYFSTKKIEFSNLDYVLVIFFILGEITTITSYSVSDSSFWLAKLIRGLIIFFIFSRIKLFYKDFISITYILFSIIVLEFLLALFQFITMQPLGLPLESVYSGIDLKGIYFYLGSIPFFRGVGTFSHPNTLGLFAVITLPILITSFYNTHIKKVYSILLIILCYSLVFLSLSRWAMICAMLGSFICMSLLIRYKFIRLQNLILLSKSLFLIIIIFLFTITSTPTFTQRYLFIKPNDTSINSRLDLASESLYLVKENPMGFGGDTFRNLFADYDVTNSKLSQTFLYNVHSFYLLIINELGIFGLLIFVIIAGEICRLFFKKMSLQKKDEQIIAIGFFASLMIFLIYGTVELISFGGRMILFFWLFLGLMKNVLSIKTQKINR